MSFEGHTANVTAVGFHRDRKWMFTGAEDLSVRIWDLRAPTAQREYKQKGEKRGGVQERRPARGGVFDPIDTRAPQRR